MIKNRRITALLVILSLLLHSVVLTNASIEARDTVERVREVESLRQKDSETYLMSDGSYECIIYASDKYYYNSAQTLQQIDNAVKQIGTSKLGARQYKNSANAFDVYFRDGTTPEIQIGYSGKTVTFSPLAQAPGLQNHIVADSFAALVGTVEDCDVLNEITETGENTVTYENAFFSTNLVYVVENGGLKEYIVVKDSSAPNAYSFLFSLNGVSLQTIDGVNVFYDASGDAVFTLGSLYAIDDAGAFTDDVTYDFVPVKGTDQIIVTVTISESYLNDEDRVFPVIIDPSVMVSSSQTADACVCSNYPDTNYQMSTVLRTGYETGYGRRRSYIKFNIPSSIPAGRVTGATLDIEKVSGAAPTVQAYRCVGNWSSGTITWNNKPNFSTINASTTSAPRSSGSSWYRMNVSEIVKAWANNSITNYGFVLVDLTESNSNHWTTLYSSDASSPHKPELHITYTGQETTPYYGCKQYYQENDESINCHGYAFFTNNTPAFLNIDDIVAFSNAENSDEALPVIEAAMERWLNSNFSGRWQTGSLNSELQEGQWLIAMRTGVHLLGVDDIRRDFHFWYRTDTGRWAHKPGSYPSEELPQSDLPTSDASSGWDKKYGDITDPSIYDEFYDSERIVYYIVTEQG